MDVFSLIDDLGAWRKLIRQFNAGEKLNKSEFEKALASPGPIPEKAKPIILSLAKRESIFRKGEGRKKLINQTIAARERETVIGLYYDLIAILEGGADNHFDSEEVNDLISTWKSGLSGRLHGALTARDLVLDTLAGYCDMTPRAFENLLEKDAKELAKQLKIADDEAVEFRRYQARNMHRK
jgi:hypothetical protein